MKQTISNHFITNPPYIVEHGENMTEIKHWQWRRANSDELGSGAER